MNKRPQVYVRLDGVLSEKTDLPTRWQIGAKLPHADEVIAFAREFGEPVVYGEATIGLRGIRAVQRWLFSHGIDADVTHLDPPEGAEVIDQWPLKTPSTSTSETNPTTQSTP